MITLLQPVYDYSLHNRIVTATIESEPAGSHCYVTIWSRPARYAISTNHPSRLLAVGNECVRATCIVLLNSPLCHLSPSARGVLSLLMMGDVKSDSLLLKGGWGCNPPHQHRHRWSAPPATGDRCLRVRGLGSFRRLTILFLWEYHGERKPPTWIVTVLWGEIESL